MSWRASGHVKNLVEGINGEKISRSEKLLLLIIADYYNDSYECAWPKIADLAEQAMLSPRRVRELQRSCEEKGLITISERRLLNGSNDANEIRFPGLEGAAKSRRGGLRDGGDPYKEEPTHEPTCEPTHTQAAPADVCVSHGSQFDEQQLSEYAAAQGKKLINPAGWMHKAREGKIDREVEKWVAAQKAKICPRCRGSGFWCNPERDYEPEICTHPGLATVATQS